MMGISFPWRSGKHPRLPKKQAASNSNGQHICGYRQHPVGRRSTHIMWRNCAWSEHVNRFCFQNRDSNIAEEKSHCKVGYTSAERRTESSSQEGRRRTAAMLRGKRWAVFEQNCCHRWNMDTRFWINWNLSPLSGSMQLLLTRKNVAANNWKLNSWWLWLMTRMEW